MKLRSEMSHYNQKLTYAKDRKTKRIFQTENGWN